MDVLLDSEERYNGCYAEKSAGFWKKITKNITKGFGRLKWRFWIGKLDPNKAPGNGSQ